MTATQGLPDPEQLESLIAIVQHRVPFLRAELEQLRAHIPAEATLYCSSTLDRIQWTAKVLQELLRRPRKC